MPELIEIETYRLEELPEAAKVNARSWYRETGLDYEWHDFTFDDFERACDILGVSIKTDIVRLRGGLHAASRASTSAVSGTRATVPASRASTPMRRAPTAACGVTRRWTPNSMLSLTPADRAAPQLLSSSARVSPTTDATITNTV
jgi:hypothetical protein